MRNACFGAALYLFLLFVFLTVLRNSMGDSRELQWNTLKPTTVELKKWGNRKEIELIAVLLLFPFHKTYGTPKSWASILWLNRKKISDFSLLAGKISKKNRLFLTHFSLPYLDCNAMPLPVMSQQSYHYQGLTITSTLLSLHKQCLAIGLQFHADHCKPSRPSLTRL